MLSVTEQMIDAVQSGDIVTVTQLLDAGADVHARSSSNRTALLEAAAYEQQSIVELLLSRGADPNASDINGITALMEAASGDDVDCLRVLVRHGARIDTCDNFGDAALVYATNQNQKRAVEFLRRLHDAAA
jgi:ankyrin repeat protein